jgi:hypothetical protein
MTFDGILIFFYVDDIVLAVKVTKHYRAMRLVSQRKLKHFNIFGGEDLQSQWFSIVTTHRSLFG